MEITNTNTNTNTDAYSKLSEHLNGALLNQLKLNPAGVKVHELVSLLQAEDALGLRLDASDPMGIFRVNFILMHALFSLQGALFEEGFWLDISVMKVQLQTLDKNPDTQELSVAGNEALKAYYLDWGNLTDTSEREVTQLLEDFWQRYWSLELAEEAYAVLGLEPTADIQAVKLAYRRLAARHHPDKGGDAEQFLEIRQAYEDLMRH